MPLYLNAEEAYMLEFAVGVVLTIDAAAGMRASTQIIRNAEGPGGVARLDRLQAAGRERSEVLNSLRTALSELQDALERTHREI